MKKSLMNSEFHSNMALGGANGAQPSAQQGSQQAGYAPNLLGFTFHLSWMFLFLYLQEPGGSAEVGAAAGPSPLYLASTLALAATLGAFAIKPAQLSGLMAKRAACLGAAAITALGTLGYCIALVSSWLVGPAAVACGILTGVGSGALASQWAQAFGRAGVEKTLGVTPGILAGAVALCVTLPLLPHEACMLIVCILPLLSGAFAHRAAPAAAVKRDEETVPLSRSEGSRYLVLAAFAATLGVILGCLNVSTHNPLFAEYLSLFFATATIAVLSACVWQLHKRSTADFLLAGIAPVCAIACLLVLLMKINENDFFSSFIPTGSTCLEMLFLATLVIFSIRFGLSTVRTFAIGRISYALFYLAGTAAGTQLNIAGSETTTVQMTSFLLFAGIELITAAAIIGLVFARQTEKGSRERMNLAASEHARASAKAEAAQTASSAEQAGRQKADALPNACADRGSDVGAINAGKANVAAQKPRMQSESQDAHDETGLLDRACSTRETASPSGKFERRVADFAEQHGLSARETDVLRQLLKGRGYARIQQELHIAEGTVNYHVRNIYAKTGVHSREKLVDLFDKLE